MKHPPRHSKKQAEGHAQLAYRGIRQMLFHNDIGPGQKISYRDLAERLGMSPTPVIQALKWLEFQQLVYHRRHRGYYTAPISVQEVGEAYDLRRLIEVSLLPETIKRLDDHGQKHLRKALADHRAAVEGNYLYSRLSKDMAFHLCLAELSGCKVQLQALTNVFDLLYLKYGGNLLFSTSVEAAYQDHQSLVDKLVARDLAGATTILRQHLLHVKRHVCDGLQRTVRERARASV
jgi:DNA-binding GntR family transcriptional regulator